MNPVTFQQFAERVDQRLKSLFILTATGVYDSVVFGSPVTGAPGQPVDTGALRASWQLQFTSETTAELSTNMEYAPGIEDGVGTHGPLTLRSGVGGFHSVKATRANFERLVEDVARKVVV